MTRNGELDPQITKFIIEEYDTVLQEQQIFQNMLQVDFSKVITSYNNYILNDDNLLTPSAPAADSTDTTAPLEEIEELDDLEEI